MKKDIHPKYYNSKIVCNCGNVIEVGATVAEMQIEVCGKCHPFYTGQQRLLDTTGRVEKFNKKYAKFFQNTNSDNK